MNENRRSAIKKLLAVPWAVRLGAKSFGGSEATVKGSVWPSDDTHIKTGVQVLRWLNTIQTSTKARTGTHLERSELKTPEWFFEQSKAARNFLEVFDQSFLETLRPQDEEIVSGWKLRLETTKAGYIAILEHSGIADLGVLGTDASGIIRLGNPLVGIVSTNIRMPDLASWTPMGGGGAKSRRGTLMKSVRYLASLTGAPAAFDCCFGCCDNYPCYANCSCGCQALFVPGCTNCGCTGCTWICCDP